MDPEIAALRELLYDDRLSASMRVLAMVVRDQVLRGHQPTIMELVRLCRSDSRHICANLRRLEVFGVLAITRRAGCRNEYAVL